MASYSVTRANLFSVRILLGVARIKLLLHCAVDEHLVCRCYICSQSHLIRLSNVYTLQHLLTDYGRLRAGKEVSIQRQSQSAAILLAYAAFRYSHHNVTNSSLYLVYLIVGRNFTDELSLVLLRSLLFLANNHNVYHPFCGFDTQKSLSQHETERLIASSKTTACEGDSFQNLPEPSFSHNKQHQESSSFIFLIANAAHSKSRTGLCACRFLCHFTLETESNRPATQGLSPGSTYTATVGQFASDSRQRPAFAVWEMGSRIWTGVFVDVRHTTYDRAELGSSDQRSGRQTGRYLFIKARGVYCAGCTKWRASTVVHGLPLSWIPRGNDVLTHASRILPLVSGNWPENFSIPFSASLQHARTSLTKISRTKECC